MHLNRDIVVTVLIGAAAGVLGVMASGGQSRTLHAVWDPNDCVPVRYDPNLMPEEITIEIDPNAIRGYLLPPICGDPNTWIVPAGKYNRVGQWCDPQGYPIVIEYALGTIERGVTVDCNQVDGTWTLAAELPPGNHVLYLRAQNLPPYGDPVEQWFTICLRAESPPIEGPRLY